MANPTSPRPTPKAPPRAGGEAPQKPPPTPKDDTSAGGMIGEGGAESATSEVTEAPARSSESGGMIDEGR